MSNDRLRRLFYLLLAVMIPCACFAHPMGNFSVNHYSKISLQNDRIKIQYIIDLAEIPAYQELQQGNITASPGAPAVTRFIASRGAELQRGLSLTVDGKPLPLHLKSSGVIFPPGAGGLPTMKMGFVYEAAYPNPADPAHVNLHYADNNYPGHTGWKEIVAVASAGSLLRSSVASTDRSAELTNYPTDLLSSPPQDLEASFEAAFPPVLAAVPASSPRPPLSPQPVAQNHGSAPSGTPATQAGTSAVHTGSTSKAVPESPKLGRASPATSPLLASSTAASPSSSSVAAASTGQPEVTAAPAAIQLHANQQQTPRSRFTELITTQRLSPWFLFTAAFVAMGLGALHALEPGHGKTIVAAYLVGSRGTARHAALLGLIVTVSHTAGVFALGAITLYASRYIVPEQLYPWLGVLSGLIIAGLGIYMFLRRLSGTATDHTHTEASMHGHWFSKRSPAGAIRQEPAVSAATVSFSNSASRNPSPNFIQTSVQDDNEACLAPMKEAVAGPVSLTQLFTLGVTGGIIPCPAALIVLLSAFALHRIALGFFLIVAFSAGLAAVLIGFGLLMVYARRFMSHLQVDGPWTKRWLPLASSAFITILGIGLTLQGLAATHLNASLFSKERLGPVLFVTGLGLILGMRHSTDADHVVAISTIVTNQRSIRNAAFIGSVWGLGHTITIFIVGSLIILFGVQIPPRIGLSMEFSVALMLILLGILNLTGVMQKITTRFTPRSLVAAPSDDPNPTPSAASRTQGRVGRTIGRFGLYQFFRPLVIGLVHGLAGSAAIALLVLSTIHDPIKATIYLLIFGFGTLLGMMLMTAAIAVPITYAGARFSNLSRYLGIASGMVSLCFGSFLVYQLGFLGGLFTGHPQWTPR